MLCDLNGKVNQWMASVAEQLAGGDNNNNIDMLERLQVENLPVPQDMQ